MSPHFLLPLASTAVSAASQTLRAVGEQFRDSATFLLGGSAEEAASSSTTAKSGRPSAEIAPELRGPLSQLLGAAGAGASDQLGLFRQIDVLQEHVQKASEEFHDVLTQQLAAAGVSLPVELQGDGFGGVEVVGSHPQRSEIEAFFARQPQLSAAFNNLTTNISLLRNLSSQSSSSSRSETVRLRVEEDGVAAQF